MQLLKQSTGLWRAAAVAILLLCLRIPVNMFIWKCAGGQTIIPYVAMLQVIDALVIGCLVFKLGQLRLRKPWTCPVCKGWGKRPFIPSKEALATMENCPACLGACIVWESALF